jgi:hypothetical protein
MSLHAVAPDLSDCIEQCWHCHATCLATALNHCLVQGGAHTEREHFTTMLLCAEVCQVAANAMLASSVLHPRLCATCAEICAQCADSCEGLAGMEACVRDCRRCQRSCEEMAAQPA